MIIFRLFFDIYPASIQGLVKDFYLQGVCWVLYSVTAPQPGWEKTPIKYQYVTGACINVELLSNYYQIIIKSVEIFVEISRAKLSKKGFKACFTVKYLQ